MNTPKNNPLNLWCRLRPTTLSAALAAIALLVSAVSGEANVVTMTAVDSSGASSLSSAGKWDNLAAPSGGNDYFSSVYYIRTPASGNVIFAGNSLTLQPPAAAGVSGQVAPSRSILFKGVANASITINTVTNAGGVINAGSGNVLGIFNGNAMYVISNSTIQADQGPFQIGWALYGSGDLTNTSGNGRTITYTNNNSAFTGRFVINNNVTVAFNSPNGAPGNPAVSTTSQIDLGAGCTLLDNAGISLVNANGGITLEGSATINASSNTMTISEPITDNGANYNLIKRGGGILTLSGNNTFGGGLSLYGITAGGQLNINSATALGTGTFTINNGNAAVIDNTSGSPLTMANNISQMWGNSFAFGGTGNLNFGTGTVTITNNITVTVSNNVLTVGPVTDTGLGYGLTKYGPGTLALNAGVSYVSSTVVSNGTLAITSGTLASSTNLNLATSTAVLNVSGIGGLSMAANQTLSGSGGVTGSVTDNSGAFILPGGTGAAGTLTVNGNLTLNGGATMNFDISTNNTPGGGTNDLVVVTGALNALGATTVNILGVAGSGNYTLIQYGSFSGVLANLSVPIGFALTNDTTAKVIRLLHTHIPTTLTWVGDGINNVWDTGTTTNWLAGATPAAFFSGDTVFFTTAGSSSPSINLASPAAPSATVVNSVNNYDFTGNGILTGSLTKTNSGTLILENNNSYSGATIINGGTLQVGNGAATGALGTGVLSNNAALALNRSDAVTLPSPIYGTGTVTLAGSGTVTASGSNYYTGSSSLNNGILFLANSAGLGATNGAISVANGAEMYITANVDIGANPLTLAGSGVASAGALRKGGAGVSAYYGTVSLSADTTLNVDTGATLNLTNSAGLNGAAANANLTLSGGGAGNFVGPMILGTGGLTVNGGTWTVAPSNSFAGLTAINAGTLLISGSQSLGQPPVAFNSSQVTLSGGTLGAAATATLNDGNIGINLAANSGLSVTTTNAVFTISNDISGGSSIVLTKSGPGELILNGPNDFSGTLDIDSSSTGSSDGITVIANNASIANLLAVPGIPFINIRNNNGGSSTLGLDGTLGNLSVGPDIGLNGRNVGVQAIENLAGSNTIAGNITINVGGTFYIFQSDSGTLVLSAPIPYATPTTIPRSLTFQGNGSILVSGVIQDGSSNGSSNIWMNAVKTGGGVLTLAAANTCSGTTVVSNGVLQLTGSLGIGGATVAGGLLVGTGSINGPVLVQGGSIESGGTNTLGTLTLGNTLTLGGNTIAKINKTSVSSDLFSGQTSVTYGGTLTVTNLSGTLTTNDTFTLFSPGASPSNFSGIIGSPGAGLAYSFTNGVLHVVTGIANNPTNILFSVSGGNLLLSWPSDHRGWILQAQTNSLSTGLIASSNAWFDLSGSASVISNSIPIDAAKPTVFYRLRHP